VLCMDESYGEAESQVDVVLCMDESYGEAES